MQQKAGGMERIYDKKEKDKGKEGGGIILKTCKWLTSYLRAP